VFATENPNPTEDARLRELSSLPVTGYGCDVRTIAPSDRLWTQGDSVPVLEGAPVAVLRSSPAQ
jgi:hypothetical protein